jgi:hypothetical protein
VALAVVQLGLSLAFFALSLLLRPKPEDVEGGRLEDNGVTTSGFGSYLTKAEGTPRVSGETIWVFNNEFKEISHSQKIGGKGGGSATSTSYTYTTSFASSFGEGVAAGVRRIWLNSKLVYDVNGEIPIKGDLEFRFYSGDEDQLPDPLIESDLDVRIGPNSTPAFRGQPYIVFVDLSMEDYGNVLPNVEAELEYATSGGAQFTGTEIVQASQKWVVTDFDRNRLALGLLLSLSTG